MDSLELSDDENEIGTRADKNNRFFDDDDNAGIRSDEAEEDGRAKNSDEEENGKARRIDPATSKKRVTRNPQPKLNAERIQGPKGVQTIEKYFEGFKFQGKGHEKSDLDKIMKRLEHWAHRLFPKYQFDDFLEKMEVLGTKKNVQVYLKKYRLGMELAQVDAINEDDEVERGVEQPILEEAQVDEFDRLIAEQIEKQRRDISDHDVQSNVSIAKPSGNVLGTAKTSGLTDEMKARIEANRQLAIERKNARLRRLEEESKRQKLQESQSESQVFDAPVVNASSDTPIANILLDTSIAKASLNTPTTNATVHSSIADAVVHTEESNTVIPQTIQSDIITELPMEISTSPLEEKNSSIVEPIKHITAINHKNTNDNSFNVPLKIEEDGHNVEDIEANKPDAAKPRITIANIKILDKEKRIDITKSNESYNSSVYNKTFEEEMECSDITTNYEDVNKKTDDDTERLLTKEELQWEIDNAIEEIINKNAQRKK